jgi:serine/threonine-protein kinase
MPPSTRTCPDCSAELADSNRFCPSCGARTPQYTASAPAQPAAAEGQTSEAAHRARLQRALGAGWQITRLIGRGGFAEVYAALDVNLRREVAVKTLRHDLEVSPQMLQRFRREAESVARLRHPNIVPIYQVGEGEGIVYFIMPVIEGESLATALVRDGSFSIGDTCRVLREVAGALGAAHRMGVVHRDVKPDNIMLEGPERRAVVMDFGIAKLADAAEARLTGTGLLIGSPHYMSPEQAAGESELDQRSDQYSLAVVGYQMLAGRMPFEATSVQSVLFKQMTETPPPIAALRPDVPPSLEAALARALAKKPEDRFPTMEEFAAALPSGDGRRAGSPRRVLDMRTRVEIVRSTVHGWKWAALAALVIGAVGSWATFRATEPAPALAIAGSAADAQFAAKTAMPELRNVKVWTDLSSNDSVYRFIYKATRSRRTADSIGGTLGLWRWVVTGAGHAPRNPTVEVGMAGHIVAQGTVWADSVTAPTVSADSARALGLALLRQHGWSPGQLDFQRDSMHQTAQRTDHILQWTVHGAPVVSGKDGAARRQLRVTVRGDSASFYRETVLLPVRKPAARSSLVMGSVIGLITIICCVLAGLAVIMVVQRGRVDELQWKPLLILTVAIGVPATLYTAFSAADKDHQAGSGFLVALLFAVIGAFLLLPAAVAESVWSEREPRVMTGLGDMARGRLLIPEFITAALIAYPAALCLRAINGLVQIAGQAITGRAALGDAGSILSDIAPGLTPLVSAATAWCAVLLLAFGVAVLLVRAWPRWIALVAPTALLLLFMFASTSYAAENVLPVVDVLALTLILWRFGLWPAVVTMMVMVSVEGAITLFVAGGSSALGSAVIATALLCVPAALGAGAWHRVRTGELR